MDLIIIDRHCREDFLPLSYTRSIADFRIGILTLRQRWQKMVGAELKIKTADYLQSLYGEVPSTGIHIDPRFIPSKKLVEEILQLPKGEALFIGEDYVAWNGEAEDDVHKMIRKISTEQVPKISRSWDLFSLNGKVLEQDFQLLTKGRTSADLSGSNKVIGKGSIFLEEGAKVEASILNPTDGPIYLDKGAEIMEGCLVRGGFYLGEGSQLKMGAKIYGPTSIGPHSKAGGEINNSVILGFSNKAHDGFLGNSVIGEWCNLGADTNNSNLKNNYGVVKVWSEKEATMISTGLQFCGLIMGDHSKAAINTQFNTGTVTGVFANIFGGDFPPKAIPSFSWGGSNGFTTFDLDKAFDVAERVMSRRGIALGPNEREVMRHIFHLTDRFRNF